ncbi:MAG: hypothetical protein ABIE70_08070 [bacterium]
MKETRLSIAVAVIIVVALLGCSQTYQMNQSLTEPLVAPETCRIGVIEDALPDSQPPEQRPTAANLDQFRLDLATAIDEKHSLRMVDSLQPAAYEVRTKLLAFEKVDGFFVSLFPFLVNRARLTAYVELVHLESDQVVCAGEFNRSERTFIRPTAETFRGIARDFAGEVSKQNRRLLR